MKIQNWDREIIAATSGDGRYNQLTVTTIPKTPCPHCRRQFKTPAIFNRHLCLPKRGSINSRCKEFGKFGVKRGA